MQATRVAFLVIVLGCLSGGAAAQGIGVFFSQGGSDCDQTIPRDSPATWYILAILGGPAQNGITGVEFRQVGTPPGWFMSATANPQSNLSIGDPIQSGANIAFAECQPGKAGVLLLYTVSGFATTEVGCTSLDIRQHVTPSNPNYQCPNIVLCDPPLYTQVCVYGAAGIINGSCYNERCSVAVTHTTWWTMKRLYN